MIEIDMTTSLRIEKHTCKYELRGSCIPRNTLQKTAMNSVYVPACEIFSDVSEKNGHKTYRHEIQNDLLEVVEDEATHLNGDHDGREVVV